MDYLSHLAESPDQPDPAMVGEALLHFSHPAQDKKICTGFHKNHTCLVHKYQYISWHCWCQEEFLANVLDSTDYDYQDMTSVSQQCSSQQHACTSGKHDTTKPKK
jgi:hypothetical protein